MDEGIGLSDALHDGDAVVLSTGATATVRGSYPKGYRGDVRILLDGAEEYERPDGFLVIRPEPMSPPAIARNATAESPNGGGLSRAPDRRMKD